MCVATTVACCDRVAAVGPHGARLPVVGPGRASVVEDLGAGLAGRPCKPDQVLDGMELGLAVEPHCAWHPHGRPFPR